MWWTSHDELIWVLKFEIYNDKMCACNEKSESKRLFYRGRLLVIQLLSEHQIITNRDSTRPSQIQNVLIEKSFALLSYSLCFFLRTRFQTFVHLIQKAFLRFTQITLKYKELQKIKIYGKLKRKYTIITHTINCGTDWTAERDVICCDVLKEI